MSIRTDRVGSLLKEEIGALLTKEYSDPSYGFITVTDVRMTPDLRIARVYVSVFAPPARKARTAYKIAFDSGEAMGGAATLLSAAVPAGQQADVSVVLTAPNTNGTFRSNWRMQNASGVGFGNVVYVEIKVGSGSGATVTPGPSPTPGGPTATGNSGNYNVSGNVGDDGVNVDCIGTLNKPDFQVTSGVDGSYTCVVPWNWEGEIIPSKGNLNFNPDTLFVPNVTQNVGGFDFTVQ